MVGEFKGVDLMGVRVAGTDARDRGGRRKEIQVNPKRRSLSGALAMMCPTLFLKLLQEASRLEKTRSWLCCATVVDP